MTPQTPAETVPVLEIEAVLARPDARVIDLRSPAEFAADHVPGARNAHLFDDAGRALVGWLYKQASPGAAFDEGRKLVTDRVDALVAEIGRTAGWAPPEANLAALVNEMTSGGLEAMESSSEPMPAEDVGADPVVLHCWRGGLRSRSVVALVRRLGLNAVGLRGGYKAYRTLVMEQLETWQAPPAFVLRGLTGVGKTLVLREIERIRPALTLDLEGCAGHRSSLLGMVGLEPVSQKAFDSRMAERLRAGFPGRVVLEGESRKVGDSVICGPVWRAMRGATNVLLSAPTEVRVRVLMDDYLEDPSARELLRTQLRTVAERMPGRPELVQMLDGGQEAELVELLLKDYYDPLYRHSEKGKTYALEVDASDVPQAAERIVSWIESQG